MEYLILGLLILSPMTGYELQQFIRKNLALICSHSAGSVQTALSKLEKSGKVASSETVAGKRRKKTFSITEEGRAAFSAWVAQPMRAGRGKNMELSRLFFAGLARPEERLAAIRDYIRQMEDAQNHAVRDPGPFSAAEASAASAWKRLAADSAFSGIHHRVRHCRRRV